jgi:hypothetical protein
MDSEDWDIVKLATALKMVCYPDEEIKFGNPQEVHSIFPWMIDSSVSLNVYR